MPTDQNAYNSRVTDEALEKRFRDTFKSQSGAGLVDDLYASGVIVPVVDFTAAAEGSSLRSDLQSALDSATGYTGVNASSTGTTIISTPGFWQIDIHLTLSFAGTTTGAYFLIIDDGTTANRIWSVSDPFSATVSEQFTVGADRITVFLRAGDTLKATTAASGKLDLVYHQIADVSGNLNNPTGFTSS
jgi:hypothetical protein